MNSPKQARGPEESWKDAPAPLTEQNSTTGREGGGENG